MKRFLVMAMIMGCVGYGMTGNVAKNVSQHNAAIEAAANAG